MDEPLCSLLHVLVVTLLVGILAYLRASWKP
jgi:hypothetical protein